MVDVNINALILRYSLFAYNKCPSKHFNEYRIICRCHIFDWKLCFRVDTNVPVGKDIRPHFTICKSVKILMNAGCPTKEIVPIYVKTQKAITNVHVLKVTNSRLMGTPVSWCTNSQQEVVFADRFHGRGMGICGAPVERFEGSFPLVQSAN